MTVGVSFRRAGPFDGDGSTTSFAFPTFTVPETTDLFVYLEDSAGSVTLQTLDSQYTVDLVNQTVDFVVAPASGERVLILADEAYLMETDFTIGSSVDLSSLQGAVDDLSRQAQQLRERIRRAVLLEKFSEKTDLEIVDPTSSDDGRVLTWDDTLQHYKHTTVTDASSITTTAYGESVVAAADAAANRVLLSLVPDTDVPSQATYDAHIADTALHNKVVMLANPFVVLNESGDTNFGFTSFDLDSDPSIIQGTDVPQTAILRVRLFDQQADNAAGNRTLEVEIRPGGSAETTVQKVQTVIPNNIATGRAQADVERTVFVSLDAAKTFEYAVATVEETTDAIQQIWLEGYIT